MKINVTIGSSCRHEMEPTEEQILLRKEEQYWRREMLPVVQKYIRDFRAGHIDEARRGRIAFLKERNKELLADLRDNKKLCVDIVRTKGQDSAEFLMLADEADQILHKIKKNEREINALQNLLAGRVSQGAVTDEMIALAKEYDIRQIVTVDDKGFAHCVAGTHEDKHASMFCRKNFGHCFSCEWHGDAIDLFMIVNGVSFTEAVRAMQ